MSKYHNKSYQIERIIRQLNNNGIAVMKADYIDSFPLVAIIYCLMTLFEYSHENYLNINTKLAIAMDEVSCVIGSRKTDETFNFESSQTVIKGNTNSEYLDNVICFIKDNYNVIMKNHKRFSLLL